MIEQRATSTRGADPVAELLGGALGLVWWLLAGVAVAVVRRPVLALIVAVLTYGFYAEQLGTLLLGVLVTVVVLLVWRMTHPPSFAVVVGVPARCAWRRWWVYGRRWERTTAALGLVLRPGGGQAPIVPKLGQLHGDRWSERLSVRLLVGQSPAEWERAADALAHSFGARSCRVEVPVPGRLVLVFGHGDPLAAVVPALPVPASAEMVDLAGVPVGRREDGSPWVLPVLGSHLLVAGTTGAGKGSVLWGLLAGLAPAVRSGLVAVWAVDPKGGMELALGRAMFTRFATTVDGELAGLLEDAVAVMDARAARLAGHVRSHQPTVDEPLLLVLVDELASLTAYVEDRDLKRRLASALSLLLSKGRAVGVVVIAAVQDPRKEVLPFRDLFPVRVALRLPEKESVDLVLGANAAERGARADLIARVTPGVGYVLVDGRREPVRVRAGHVSDAHVHRLAAEYPAADSRLHVPPRPVLVEPVEDKPRRPSRSRARSGAEPAAGPEPQGDAA